MKPQLPAILLILGAAALTPSVWAEDPPQKYEPTGNLERRSATAPPAHIVQGSTLIGTEVRNFSGERLGKIDDLAVDVEAGRIVLVILSRGFLGGDIAVPPSAFSCEPDQKNSKHALVRLNTDKAKLKAAPEFEVSKWGESVDSSQLTQIYRYYDTQPYFSRPATSRLEPLTATNAWNRLGRVEKASKVIGMTVKNPQNENVGKVDNLLVDLPAGRVVHVLVAAGGFLGLGEQINPIPPSLFRHDAERDALLLDVTKDTLKGAPRYHADAMQGTNRVSDADIYRYYRAPYFAGSEPDNTRVNVRDRDDSTVTPFDQGTSSADVELSRSIRKALQDQTGLSVNAQNAKIITREGKVTLRGPVNSEQEKALLGEIAGRFARAQDIDNQLEVKQTRP